MPARKHTQFQTALTDYVNGRYFQSIEKLKILYQQYPENWLIKYHLGNARLKYGIQQNSRKIVKTALMDYLKSKELKGNGLHPSMPNIDKCIDETRAYLQSAKHKRLTGAIISQYGHVIAFLKKQTKLEPMKNPFKSVH